MNAQRIGLATSERDGWESGPEEVLVGIDVVELVSSSMYIEPLTSYREYIQNAADAIDDARAAGLLADSAHGRVDIHVDPATRIVRLRDNGIGLPGAEFVRRLTAFGASDKRGRQKRGFRGVGRLAAIGYCQELVFRSRASHTEPVRELRWDCRLLKTLLRAGDFTGSLRDAVSAATSHRTLPSSDLPGRFFEVELRGVVRHGNDDLLSESAIRAYLGNVAPVPFSPSFRFGADIQAFLADVPGRADLDIFVNGVGPVYRPHDNAIPIKQGLSSKIVDVQFVSIPGLDGGIAAKGWLLHSEYLGAIPRSTGVRGLRLRSGHIQVGDDNVLDQAFVEPRFNAWASGEFHILDRRIVPNGRRDQYEQSVHFGNVLNHLSPLARDVGGRCRSQSQYRQRLRRADGYAREVEAGLLLLRQGAVSRGARQLLVADLKDSLNRFQKLAQSQQVSKADRNAMTLRYDGLSRRLSRLRNSDRVAPQLRRLSRDKRRAYEEVFARLYNSATDLRGARELVDRVLRSL